MLAPVIDTSDCANARPFRLEPVVPLKLMPVPASTFPTKWVAPSNTAVVPSRQYTLHASPPLAMTTEPLMGVMDVPLKIQTPLPSPPLSASKSSVNVPVNVATPLKQ